MYTLDQISINHGLLRRTVVRQVTGSTPLTFQFQEVLKTTVGTTRSTMETARRLPITKLEPQLDSSNSPQLKKGFLSPNGF